MRGVSFSTRKLFRALDRSIPRLDRTRRRRSGGPKIDIVLKRRRLKHRSRQRRDSSPYEVVAALAFAAVALGFVARFRDVTEFPVPAYLLLPFAGVALLGLWTSRLPTAQRILWSIPAVALGIPFLPLG